jgi:Domain of unknown function (DUF4331)
MRSRWARFASMSHHFDTDQAKSDPRLNICDLYVFKGRGERTVFAMTCCADTRISSPDLFHPEGTYAFRIDTTGDYREDLAFKFRFGEPQHAPGDEHDHVQTFSVLGAAGADIPGLGGTLLAHGTTGSMVEEGQVQAFAGMAPELWAADAFAFFSMLQNLFNENRFDPQVFAHKQNLFRERNVMAIVLEVPNSLIFSEHINVWATVSLCGHAPEVQVARWGLPLITHLFLANPSTPELTSRFHTSTPTEDLESFGPAIAALSTRLSGYAGNTPAPDEYGCQLANRLCPTVLPYALGTEARFEVAEFNGRSLTDDAYDVMVSLATNAAVSDGVSPAAQRVIAEFPYYGAPFSASEQTGLKPIQGNIGYGTA